MVVESVSAVATAADTTPVVVTAPTGTLKGAFMATTYTQDQEADQFWSDVSGSLASGTSLQTIAGLNIRVDTANNRIEIDFTDPTEAGVSASTNQFLLFMDTGTAATSPLIANGALSTTLNPENGTLTLIVNVEGLAAVNY